MDKLRMRFSKTGRAIYISHLDLMRTMQRALLRGGVPLRYSEGFNPHALLSILLPLSVGCGSECELMDFRVREDMALAELPERLNAVMPEGICVLEVYEPARKVKELKWLRIAGMLEYDKGVPAALPADLAAFFARDSLVITKRTKKGQGEMDIRPGIADVQIQPEGGAVHLEALLSAQEPTVSPELLLSALRQLAPELAPDFGAFTRLEVYDSAGEVFR